MYHCVVYSREMRSKHFLSSKLGLTWQVRRFNLAGGLLGCNEETGKHKVIYEVFKECVAMCSNDLVLIKLIKQKIKI